MFDTLKFKSDMRTDYLETEGHVFCVKIMYHRLTVVYEPPPFWNIHCQVDKFFVPNRTAINHALYKDGKAK